MSAKTNSALNKKTRVDGITLLKDVANQVDANINDVLIELAREQLKTNVNAGKDTFLAVVTKVVEGHLSDPFLNVGYEVDRADGTTNEPQKDHKIVLLHIPSLHTFYTEFEEQSRENKETILSTDIYKIACVTNQNLKPQEIVSVRFENIKNLTGPTITKLKGDQRKTLIGDVKKFLKASEVMKNQNACKLQAIDDAQGYAISARTFLNPSNPTVGYDGFYRAMTDTAKKDEVLKQIVRNKTSTELKNALGLDASLSSKEALAELNSNPAYNFSIEIQTSTTVSLYLNQVGASTYGQNLIPLSASTDLDNPLTREVRIIIDSNKSELRSFIAEFLKGVVVNELNYGWSTEKTEGTKQFYKADIFGKPGIDDRFANSKKGDTALAIEYSTKMLNKSRISVGEPTKIAANAPLKSQKPPATNTQQATNQQTPAAQPKQDIPNCEDATALNDNIYINVEKQTNSTSFNKDNKKFKEALDLLAADNAPATLKNWNFPLGRGAAKATRIDVINNFKATTTPKRGLFPGFSYTKTQEVISGFSESFKQSKDALNRRERRKKLKNAKETGTNSNKIQENITQLVRFVNELAKLVATNEGIPLERVFVIPISTFRQFKKTGSKDGQDDNSRHYFGRAIDFTIYINPDSKIDLESKEMPLKGTYEIPNNIVYLYVLKLLKFQKDKFGTCGLALLRRGTKRKSGYVHYEYMRETSSENVGLLLNRRWVSKPLNKKDKSVYGKAFGQPDANKDEIIKSETVREIKAKLGFLPEKIEFLLG